MIKISGTINNTQGEKSGVTFSLDTTSIREMIGVTDLGRGFITSPICCDQFLTETHATARDIYSGESLKISWSVPKGFYSFDVKYLEVDMLNIPLKGLKLSPIEDYFQLQQSKLAWTVGADGSLSLNLKELNQKKTFLTVNVPSDNDKNPSKPNTFFAYGFVFKFKIVKGGPTYYGRIDPLIKLGSLDGPKP